MELTRAIYLRCLGLVYLLAFGSLWPQLDGLFGADGVVPAIEFMNNVLERRGSEAYGLLPTLLWWMPSDAAMHGLCAAGVGAALLLILGFLPLPAAVVCWLCYLSLDVIGEPFLRFQWDTLLLETGFLAIFLAPLVWRSSADDPEVPMPVVWLHRWLLFRLMFFSGWVKLASGDPTWRGLTAMDYHYWTQPLPPPIAYYLAGMPAWFHRCETLLVLVLELVVPFLIFTPLRWRRWACGIFVVLMALIQVSGNYGFFNLLTVALCVLLLDDSVWPERWLGEPHGRSWPYWIVWPVTVAMALLSLVPTLRLLRLPEPPPLGWAYRKVVNFGLVNSYGLFAVMTTERPELVIEGSDDGQEWKAYELPYKPGDPGRAPRWVAPHQPRLDWQLWFAALGSPQRNPWLFQVCRQLLRGSPAVLGLFAHNPFPEQPPRYLRVVRYQYRFADDGSNWWQRGSPEVYLPPMSLRPQPDEPAL